jgi:FkbM family methyltransferase
VTEGDLVFDVGAHLGDRSVAFAALGARVIALEPQPHVARWLQRIVGGNERIVVRREAVGSAPGVARLAISSRHPTVSSLSDSWRESVTRRNPGFEGVRWEQSVDVPVVTLDGLIDAYGRPRFCKIDVEGYEPEVLAGLSEPIAAVSFEFVAGQLEVAAACVRRLRQLGPYLFNVVLGEGRQFAFAKWIDADVLLEWLGSGADGASSGDIYARLALEA